jgi:hypothetical protein
MRARPGEYHGMLRKPFDSIEKKKAIYIVALQERQVPFLQVMRVNISGIFHYVLHLQETYIIVGSSFVCWLDIF